MLTWEDDRTTKSSARDMLPAPSRPFVIIRTGPTAIGSVLLPLIRQRTGPEYLLLPKIFTFGWGPCSLPRGMQEQGSPSRRDRIGLRPRCT
jgi:hypothetical protein